MTKQKFTSVFLMIAIFTFNGYLYSYGQPDSPNKQLKRLWAKQFESTFIDNAIALDTDDAQNVYVTGTVDRVDKDIVTIKYNKLGTIQWIVSFAGAFAGDDVPRDIFVSGGFVYITGSTPQFGGGGFTPDLLTLKYNTLGTLIWTNEYNGPGNFFDNGVAVKVNSAGDVFVAGTSDAAGAQGDFVVIKYNSNGIQQWSRRYDGPLGLDETCAALEIDNLSNVYVTGTSTGSPSLANYATVKYNSNGVLQWAQLYGGPINGVHLAEAIGVDNNLNVFVTGQSTGAGSNQDYATIKYNSLGVQQWIQRYNGTANDLDEAWALVVDLAGNIYITGNSEGQGTTDDVVTIKYNTDGLEKWINRYDGGNVRDFATRMVVDDRGSLYVSGSQNSPSAGRNYLTLRYNASSGAITAKDIFDGPAHSTDIVNDICLDIAGRPHITGTISVLNNDYYTIKYEGRGIIGKTSEEEEEDILAPIHEVAVNVELHDNYPNPFAESTTINYSLPSTATVGLKIYSITGSIVRTLVNNEVQSEGIYSVDVDGESLPFGMYFYHLDVNGSTSVKKNDKTLG